MSKCFEVFPKRDKIKYFLKELKSYLYPNYFEDAGDDVETFKKNKLDLIKDIYIKYICKTTVDGFVAAIPDIKKKLEADLEFFYESDPAADSKPYLPYVVYIIRLLSVI